MARDPLQIFDSRFGADRPRRRPPTLKADLVNGGIDADRAAAAALGLRPLTAEVRSRIGRYTPKNVDDMLSATETTFARKPALARACGTSPDFPRLLARSHAIAASLILIYSAMAETCGRGRLGAVLALRDLRQRVLDGCAHVTADAAQPADAVAHARHMQNTLVALDAAPQLLQASGRRAAGEEAAPSGAEVEAELHRISDSLLGARPAAAAPPPAPKPAGNVDKKAATKTRKTTRKSH